MPKHFQKPIVKGDMLIDTLEFLGLHPYSDDYVALGLGLNKLSRNELAVLHHQLWSLTRKLEAK